MISTMEMGDLTVVQYFHQQRNVFTAYNNSQLLWSVTGVEVASLLSILAKMRAHKQHTLLYQGLSLSW